MILYGRHRASEARERSSRASEPRSSKTGNAPRSALVYITNARMPTEKAHGLQIMKTCEALVRAGHELTLVVPRRRNSIPADPFAYWNIPKLFPIRLLPTLDLIRYGRLGFLVQAFTFALAASSRFRGAAIGSSTGAMRSCSAYCRSWASATSCGIPRRRMESLRAACRAPVARARRCVAWPAGVLYRKRNCVR